jgi:D-threo-aldose 1-dehydrogenase
MMQRRPLGNTKLRVTPLCSGGAVLASMPATFGYDVPEARAVQTVRRVLRGPLNFLDTSAGYGGGESERRIGIAIREEGGLPPGFVLATKIDPDPITNDFSGDQALRSVEESMGRLGLDTLPLVHLHDPERITFEQAMAGDGPVQALLRLQREGVVAYVGVAGGPIDLLRRLIATGAFQVVLTHNRHTLVDRSAEPLLQDASEAGLGVVNAAVYGGGILAKGPENVSTYAYREASPELIDRIGRMRRLCAEAGVSLQAAALQFSLREPRIHSTVVGFSRPDRVDECVALAETPIPERLWSDLDALTPP